MLVILGVWRHVYKKFPPPLGRRLPLVMYTVFTFRLAAVTGTPS